MIYIGDMPGEATTADLRKRVLDTNAVLAGWLKSDDLEGARKYLHSAEFRDVIRHCGFDVIFKDGAEAPVYEELKQGKRPNLVIDAHHLRTAHGAPAIILRLIERLAFTARKKGGGANLSEESKEMGLRVPAPQDVGAYMCSLGINDESRLSGLQSVMVYRNRKRMNALTRASLAAAYPERKFYLFSIEGSSSDVYVDTDSLNEVFKVLMPESPAPLPSPGGVPSVELTTEALAAADEEAKKLKSLGEAGLAPKLIEYLPADSRPGVFLPILRVERVEFAPEGIHDLPIAIRESESARISAGLEKLHLAPYDTEMVYDIPNNRVVAIDAGGMSLVTEEEIEKGEVSRWVRQHLDI